MQPALSRAARGARLLQGATILRLRHHHAHVMYDASPPRECVSSAAQTHHGAASSAQTPAGAAQTHDGAASNVDLSITFTNVGKNDRTSRAKN
jgi:hypothetical protein